MVLPWHECKVREHVNDFIVFEFHEKINVSIHWLNDGKYWTITSIPTTCVGERREGGMLCR